MLPLPLVCFPERLLPSVVLSGGVVFQQLMKAAAVLSLPVLLSRRALVPMAVVAATVEVELQGVCSAGGIIAASIVGQKRERSVANSSCLSCYSPEPRIRSAYCRCRRSRKGSSVPVAV